MRSLLDTFLGRFGYALVKREYFIPLWDMQGPDEREFVEIRELCSAQTMTSQERMYALYNAVCYLLKREVPGAFVECGVWRGGSSMLMAHTALRRGVSNREIYLFDTFSGMSGPTERDRDFAGKSAKLAIDELGVSSFGEMCRATKDIVSSNMARTEYPAELVRLIEGKVEDTIPAQAPEQIALLRLDTDWYESTYHELNHLYPRLAPGGVLIIDDYGHWKGAKEATDQYFSEIGEPILLNRIDSTGRIAVKV